MLGQYGEEVLQIQGTLESAREGRESALGALGSLASDLVGQSSESRELLRAVFAMHLSCSPVRHELPKCILRGRPLLAEIFALGQERGEFRRDLSPELSQLMRLIFMGVTAVWAVILRTACRERPSRYGS